MSHFSVVVFGEDVEGQLQPYHEYECTGLKDQYVVEVDITDEVISKYRKPVAAIQLADGTYHNRYDNKFYTKTKDAPDERFVLPEGATEVELSADDARLNGLGYATLDDAAKYYFGEDILYKNGKYYRLTNPKSKWDWYQIGGRWTGFFKAKKDFRGFLSIGRPGLMTDPARVGYFDQAKKEDIDYDGMVSEVAEEAALEWEKVRKITGGLGWDAWEIFLGMHPNDLDTARKLYREQPAIVSLRKYDDYKFWMDDALGDTKESYVASKAGSVMVPYAYVIKGKWYGKGDMGWWGISNGDVQQSEWNKNFLDVWNNSSEDTLVTVVDCHI